MPAHVDYTRFLKYIAIIVLGTIFVGSILIVSVYMFVTPDHVRRTVIPVLEGYLNCEVDFNTVDVGIFSGVSFTGLSLAEKTGAEPWFQVEKAVLRYRLLPLLGGRIVIDELSLETPVLLIDRDNSGRVSIGSLCRDVFTGANTDEGSPVRHEKAVLHISRVDVARGSVLFRDFVFGPIPRLTRIQNLGLQLDDFSSDSTCRIVCWGKLNGAPVDVEGSFNPHASQGEFDLIIENLDSVAFYPYYRRHVPVKINRLYVNTNLQVHFDAERVLLNGTTDCTDVDIVGKNSNDYEFTAEKLHTTYVLKWDRHASIMKIEQLRTLCDGLESDLQGSVSFTAADPEYELQIDLQKWPLRNAVETFRFPILTRLKPYSLTGHFSARFDVQGKYPHKPKPVQLHTISLDKAQMGVAHLRLGLSGDLNIDGVRVHAPSLQGKIGGEKFSVALDCADWRAPVPRIQIEAQTTQLDVTNLLPLRSVPSGAVAPDDSGIAVAAEPGPFNLPVALTGWFGCKQMIYKDLSIADLKGRLAIYDNVLRLDGVTGVFEKSLISGSFTLDLGRQGFAYTSRLAAKDLSLAGALRALSPQSMVETGGTAQLNAEFFGAGTHALQARRNLFAHIELSAHKGFIDRIAPLQTLAQRLGIPALSRHEFNSAQVSLEVNPGADIASFSLLTHSEPSRLALEGTVGWDGRLEGNLKLSIDPELLRAANVAELKVHAGSANVWPVAAFKFTGKWDRLNFVRTDTQE